MGRGKKSPVMENAKVQTEYPNSQIHIAEISRSLEMSFTTSRLVNEKILTENANLDFKENRKLKHSFVLSCANWPLPYL